MPSRTQRITLLRLPQVLELVGCGRTSVYEWQRSAGFPAPIRLGRRSVAWREADILDWIASRPQAKG